MSLNSYYQRPDPKLWQGRSDGPEALRLHEVITCLDLAESKKSKQAAIALIGFACDVGVKRNLGNSGADQGPKALRQALCAMPANGFLQKIYDVGDIICADENLEKAQEELALAIYSLIEKNCHPIVLGGGHEVALGTHHGIKKAYPLKNISLFNFDAHFDLRMPLKGHLGTSGTSFYQIAMENKAEKKPFNYSCFGVQSSGNTEALFTQAKALNVNYVLADSLHIAGIEPALEILDDLLSHTDTAHVSLCLDVFAAAFAPGVSAPQPLGLFPWHVLALLKPLAASGKVAAFDIAELCPRLDKDQMTAKLAANIIYHYLTYRAKAI